MSNEKDRERLRRELALQIEGEITRGITFWSDPEWNEAARDFLTRRPKPRTPQPARAEQPRSKARPPAAKRPPASRSAPHPPASRSARRRAPQPPSFGPPPEATGRAGDWQKQLEALGSEAAACAQCGLSKTRTNVVFNSGSGEVPLVFIGEAPGADEDAQGEAFVGRAGQLLTRIIAAIGLDRKDVYICNVLKCRPPNNRNPLPDEIATCSPYLMKQLEILKPRVICTLGLFATQLLLESKAPIGKLRGRVFKFHGIPLLPTYHPAALLRNPNLKRTVWEDVQLLRKILDEGVDDKPADEVPEQRTQKTAPTMGDLFG